MFVTENIVIKGASSNMRKKIESSWSLVLILTNLIHVEVAFNNQGSSNSELNSNTKYLGIGALLAWISLNAYLRYSTDYAYLPNTIVSSTSNVLNGLIGIFPFAFGIAILASSIMYEQFRFRDPTNAMMTMFYIMNGDTMFDTITGIS